MKKPITQEQFEDILFDPSRSITERKVFSKSKVQGKKSGKVELRDGNKLVAVKEVLPGTVNFYEVV